MVKSSKKIKSLVESDFRLIRQAIENKHHKDFTTEYIRKVHKGIRRNERILEEIERYLELRREFENKLGIK